MDIAQHGSMADVLRSVKARIIEKEVFTEPNVFISLKMFDAPKVNANTYCKILPLNEDIIGTTVAGHGRWATECFGRVDVYLYHRLFLDQVNRDDAWLTDETLGVLGKRQSIISALHMYYDNTVMSRPMTLSSLGEPRKEQGNYDWGDCRISFSTYYYLGLDPQTDRGDE